MREWVTCPICGEPDMPKENFRVRCLNENCDTFEFAYTIARLWHPEQGYHEANLCIYTYGHEFHVGTKQDAEGLLNYVRWASRNSKDIHPDNPYKIYKISFERID